jgi:hypothetical protein
MDKRVDLSVAVGFLAFGVWLLVASYRIPQGSVPDSIGSGGVARVLAIVVIAFTAYLIGRRLIAWRSTGNTVPAEGSTDNDAHPASAVRGLYLMQVRSVVKLIAIPVAYTVVTYVLFVGAFGVLLPLGVLSTWDYYLWFHL